MYAVSTRFLDTLRDSHSFYTYAELWYNGSLTRGNIAVVDGSITVDRTAQIRRQLSVTLGDTTLFPKYVQSPLAPFGAEIRIYQGLQYLDNTQEVVPLGVFTIEEVDREDSPSQQYGGLPVITAYDRSQVLKRDQFIQPADYSGWSIRDAIQKIVGMALPSVTVVFDPALGDATLPGGTIFNQDRLSAVQALATSLGGESYFDVEGVLQVVPVPTLTQANLAAGLINPAWVVDASTTAAQANGAKPKGVLVTALRGISRTNAFNAVAVYGNANGSDPQPYAIALDTDSRSPSYWGGTTASATPGPYGHVPDIQQISTVTSTAQAQTTANALLANSLGAARSLSFQSLHNPALEAGDLLKFIFSDGTVELHLLDSFSVPLNPSSGQFTGTTRTTSYQLQAGT